MPFIPTDAGIARCRFHWDLEGPTGVNVFYVDTGLGTVLSDAQCATLAEKIYNGWHNTGTDDFLMNAVSGGVALQSIDVEDASVNDGAAITRPVGETGDAASPCTPPGVAMVAKLLTGFRGRSRRGRMYLPGCPVGESSNNGEIADEFLNTVKIGMESLKAGIAASGGDLPDAALVVASFFSGTDPVTHAPIPREIATVTPVTSFVVDKHLHSQRRRNLHD